MEIFTYDGTTGATTQAEANSLELPLTLGPFFSLLPQELCDEILFHVAGTQFPLGYTQRIPTQLEATRDACARREQVGEHCLDVQASFVILCELRGHVRELYRLAATCKHWYMLIREKHVRLYSVLSAQHVDEQEPPYIVEVTRERVQPLKELCNACTAIPVRFSDTQWYVAAVRLLLWPKGHRTFMGYHESITRAMVTSGQVALETALHEYGSNFATEYSHIPHPNLTNLVPMYYKEHSANYGLVYIWEYWHRKFAWKFHIQLHKTFSTTERRRMVRKYLQGLFDADENVYPVEQHYWSIVAQTRHCYHDCPPVEPPPKRRRLLY